MNIIINKLFKDHPDKLNETYLQHLNFALKCGLKIIYAGIIIIIHGILPYFHETTGSRMIKNINLEIGEKYSKNLT